MDWTAYIDLAERLMRREVGAIQGANPEALARTSVSRAYYGVFNLALELSCKRYGFRPSGKADDHEGLRVHLR